MTITDARPDAGSSEERLPLLPCPSWCVVDHSTKRENPIDGYLHSGYETSVAGAWSTSLSRYWAAQHGELAEESETRIWVDVQSAGDLSVDDAEALARTLLSRVSQARDDEEAQRASD